MEMKRFLGFPKPLKVQVAVELMALMGFRNKEVTTLRVEDCYFDQGDCLVLDAKKHVYLPVPMHQAVARHIEALLNGRGNGYVFQGESNNPSKGPVTTSTIWHLSHTYAVLADLFPSPYDYCPLTFRQYFAAFWYHYLKLSLASLSRIMRHADARVTLRYVLKLHFWEDIKQDYAKFEEATAPDLEDFKVMELKVKA